MSEERIYVMSVAGFDPSGGAGLLADIKTFEQHGVYGLGVNTANTVQTENKFHSIRWESLEDVLHTIDVLMDEYPVTAVKTGIVPSFDFLRTVISHIRQKNPQVKIVVDPVISSTTNFNFHKSQAGIDGTLTGILNMIDLLTPNTQEAKLLAGLNDPQEAALALSKHGNILLKGGHSDEPGFDHLYENGTCTLLKPSATGVSAKHGSGCVLSAAIAANLGKGNDLQTACEKAKQYIEKFLSSHLSLLGTHV